MPETDKQTVGTETKPTALIAENDRAGLVQALEAHLSAERRNWIDAMISGGTPLDKWMRHTGVSTWDHLRQWAQMKQREVLILRSGRENEGPPAEDELGDYLVGKDAVLSELLANIRQIEERSGAHVTH